MSVCERKWLSPLSYAGDLKSVLRSLKMKKFNIRKVLDGLKEVSSSTPSVQVGPQENHLIQETIQSEHFQLCKVSEPGDAMIRLFSSRFALHVILFLHLFCLSQFALRYPITEYSKCEPPHNKLING